MDFDEFTRRADDIIGKLAPRIDHQQADFVRDDAYGGDWDLAFDNLIAALANHHTPITASEKADLQSLTSFMKWPDTKLDGLTVAAPMRDPKPDVEDHGA
jgi:hypothetical protein